MQLEPEDVVELLRQLEPRLAAGYSVEAEREDEFWELRFGRGGRRHRLKIDPLYLEECLDGECAHLEELLAEVCGYLEGD